jgi:hypothetical protein
MLVAAGASRGVCDGRGYEETNARRDSCGVKRLTAFITILIHMHGYYCFDIFNNVVEVQKE